ncbi:PAS domain-containing protein [Pseudomonas duriflava]|uniref:histidine kinase n=1 Tax=Pseudomonas duriflava TaxID=459528 RepID=A0A562Q2P2_9PSED|nr:PAS domain-containing protein [Pseudomonas duriflava]
MKQELDFKLLFEVLPNLNLVLSADPDFIMLAASDARLRATNTRREDCIGRSIFEVFGKNPDERAEFGAGVLRASLERVLQTRLPDRMAITKYDIPRPESEGGGFEVRYWSPLNTPVLDEQGEVRYIIHQTEDVTQKVLDEQQSRTKLDYVDERFRAALLASGTGTFSWYLDDGSLYFDNALEQLFNLPPGQALDTVERFLEHVHPEDQERVRLAFDRSMRGDDFSVEFRLYRPRTEKWLACKGKVFRDAAGKPSHVAGACTDISALKHAEAALRVSENTLRQLNENLGTRVETEVAERSKAEEALRQAQKMEAVGQLTGGIAHDFNNLLAGIIGSLELMQRRYQTGRAEGLERYIEAAVTSAQRAAALTQRLLAFSRRQALDLQPVDINKLVVSLEDFLRRTTGVNITVTTELTPGLPLACMDVNQLESAVINLVINARDAMPEGGTITLATSLFHQEQHEPELTGLKEGDYVVLSVTDTGTGMSPSVLAKVFEPFFTTKPIGQGIGWGFPWCMAISNRPRGMSRFFQSQAQVPVSGYICRALTAMWLGCRQGMKR